MDRLFHLEQTYLKSINNTNSYGNREFILLNYNSQDDIDNWVKLNLNKFIENNIVKYYKVLNQKYWCAAHAKNICYKQATGDILINLDSDNILCSNYCEYIIDLFIREDIIVASNSKDQFGNHGCCGMIACKKDHFYSVNGYDESFCIGWGLDDTNFQFRCRMKNNLNLIIQDVKYNLCVSHNNEIRTKNCMIKNIQKTKHISELLLIKINSSKNYVANQEKSWGNANVISPYVPQGGSGKQLLEK
jgi:hypothetical protein